MQLLWARERGIEGKLPPWGLDGLSWLSFFAPLAGFSVEWFPWYYMWFRGVGAGKEVALEVAPPPSPSAS